MKLPDVGERVLPGSRQPRPGPSATTKQLESQLTSAGVNEEDKAGRSQTMRGLLGQSKGLAFHFK